MSSKIEARPAPASGVLLFRVVVKMIFLLSAFGAYGLLQGCAHQVVLDSDPSGAHIVIDGTDFGEGPVTFEETSGWEEIHDVTLKKEGYRSQRTLIKQSEWNDPLVVLSLVGFLGCAWTGIGLFSLAGLGFARQLPDRVVIPLEPLPDSSEEQDEKKNARPKDERTPGQKRRGLPAKNAPDE